MIQYIDSTGLKNDYAFIVYPNDLDRNTLMADDYFKWSSYVNKATGVKEEMWIRRDHETTKLRAVQDSDKASFEPV